MIHTTSLIPMPTIDDADDSAARPAHVAQVFGGRHCVLAGDAARFGPAFEVLARAFGRLTLPPPVVPRVAKPPGYGLSMARSLRRHFAGSGSGSRELLDSIHNRKTGALFLAFAAPMGVVAGATDVQHRARRIWIATGMHFKYRTTCWIKRRQTATKHREERKGSMPGKLTFPNRPPLDRARATQLYPPPPLGAGAAESLATHR